MYNLKDKKNMLHRFRFNSKNTLLANSTLEQWRSVDLLTNNFPIASRMQHEYPTKQPMEIPVSVRVGAHTGKKILDLVMTNT